MTTRDDDLATIDDLTIRFERHLAASPSRVWRAVTDPDEMRAWFPSAVVGERQVGARLSFPFDDDVADTFEGEVTSWEPERVFAFTWNGDQLRIEVAPDGAGGTVLVFSQRLVDMTEAARTSAGWHACLANLDAHLGGPPADPEAWRTMFAAYLERMGPPRGVVGADGSMTWTRTHFRTPEEVADAFAAIAADGASIRVEKGEHVTTYAVTVPDVDVATAARWHRRLVEFDMELSTGQPFAVERDFAPDYENLLA